jgi:hypothetical protein
VITFHVINLRPGSMMEAPNASLLPVSATRMGKRKKPNTLTKIDPNVLKPKPITAVSQHASSSRTRVTVTLNPVLPRLPPTPPPASVTFDADPANLPGEWLDDGETGEDVLKGYFSAKVYFFLSHFPEHTESHPDARTTRSDCGQLNATLSSMNSSDLKVEGFPTMASVSSVVRVACIAVSIVSPFNSCVRGVWPEYIRSTLSMLLK